MYILLVLGLITILIYLFPLAKVRGTSMLPTLKEGNIIICTRIFSKKKLEKGDIYIFKSPSGRLVIKRLMVIKPDIKNQSSKSSLCWFEGDNLAESYDSRCYGYVNAERIVAKVLWKLK